VDAAEKQNNEGRNLMRRFSARMDTVWLGLGLLGIGLCVAVVATALTGTVGTVLSALGLPAMLAGVVPLDSARHRR
jgi:Ca2+/H+ antiporter